MTLPNLTPRWGGPYKWRKARRFVLHTKYDTFGRH